MMMHYRNNSKRRGATAIVMVVLMLLVAMIVIGSAVSGARDQDLTVRRVETVQSIYAAEAGMNMAIREIINNADEDGDGGVGSISDDGNDANNPVFGNAAVLVTTQASGDDTILVSLGSRGTATRRIEATLTGSAGNGAFVESGGIVVMEAENNTGSLAGAGAMSGHSWLTASALADSSGGQYMDSTPNSGQNPGDTTDGPRLDYRVNFSTTGTYYVWIRLYSPSGADNSVHAGIGTPASYGGTGIDGCCNAWIWDNATSFGIVTVSVGSTGESTFSVWMREDGTKFDKIILTTDSGYTPSGQGPTESATN